MANNPTGSSHLGTIGTSKIWLEQEQGLYEDGASTITTSYASPSGLRTDVPQDSEVSIGGMPISVSSLIEGFSDGNLCSYYAINVIENDNIIKQSILDKAISHWGFNEDANNFDIVDDLGNALTPYSKRFTTADRSRSGAINNDKSFFILMDATNDQLGIVLSEEQKSGPYYWTGNFALSIWIKAANYAVNGQVLLQNSDFTGPQLILGEGAWELSKQSQGADITLFNFSVRSGAANKTATFSVKTDEIIDTWSHISVSRQDDVIHVYFNDEEAPKTADAISGNNYPIGNEDNLLLISGEANKGVVPPTPRKVFNGSIDNIAVYNDALTLQEASFLYNNGKGNEGIYTDPYINYAQEENSLVLTGNKLSVTSDIQLYGDSNPSEAIIRNNSLTYHYLNISKQTYNPSDDYSTPKENLMFRGLPMARGESNELIMFNSLYSMSDVEEFQQFFVGGVPLTAGLINGKRYLIVTPIHQND
jgi:hypothetical protein